MKEENKNCNNKKQCFKSCNLWVHFKQSRNIKFTGFDGRICNAYGTVKGQAVYSNYTSTQFSFIYNSANSNMQVQGQEITILHWLSNKEHEKKSVSFLHFFFYFSVILFFLQGKQNHLNSSFTSLSCLPHLKVFISEWSEWLCTSLSELFCGTLQAKGLKLLVLNSH